MAQRKASTSKSAKSRTNATPSKKLPTKAQRSMPTEEKDPLWIRLWSYSWGKILYLVLGILLLIGLDLLIAMNRYNLFFTILGVEIIIAMLVGWLVYLILDRRKRFLHDEDSNGYDGE